MIMAYSSEDELINDIVDELRAEMRNEPLFNEEVLVIKVKDAVKELKRRRDYSRTMTEEKILSDLELNYPVIKKAAAVFYGQMGVEGESVHYENTVHRSYTSADELYIGIVPFVKSF